MITRTDPMIKTLLQVDKKMVGTGTCLVLLPPLQEQTARAAFV